MAAGSLHRFTTTLLALLLGTALALPARAGLTGQPQDAVFQVNTDTPSDQFQPTVASDDSGAAGDGAGDGDVVLWLDRLRSLFLRRFEATGAPLTGELRLADPPMPASWLARQNLPRIVMDEKNGSFVVLYSSSDGIWIRRFNAATQPLERLERIGLPYNATGELLLEPDAALDRAGNFEVAWRATMTGRTFILLQGFNPQGRPVGGAAPVNKVIAGLQSWPRLALDPWSATSSSPGRTRGRPAIPRSSPGTSTPPAPPGRPSPTSRSASTAEAQSAQPLAHLTADTFGTVSDISDVSDIGYTQTVTDTQTGNQKI